MAQWRLAALQRSKRPGIALNVELLTTLSPEYILVEWEDGGEHSVVDGKYAVGSPCFKNGERITCKLKEGEFMATILASGRYITVFTTVSFPARWPDTTTVCASLCTEMGVVSKL